MAPMPRIQLANNNAAIKATTNNFLYAETISGDSSPTPSSPPSSTGKLHSRQMKDFRLNSVTYLHSISQRALLNRSAPPCRMANPLRVMARTSIVFSCEPRAATSMATAATTTAITASTTLTIIAWTTALYMSTVDTQMTAITIWMRRLALNSIWRLMLSHPHPRSKLHVIYILISQIFINLLSAVVVVAVTRSSTLCPATIGPDAVWDARLQGNTSCSSSSSKWGGIVDT